MSEFRLDNDTFVIENYDKKAPFCSFLPGLAGEKGVPLWSFYVNRGQCMTSFGIDNKDNPIMEFYPANVAYENTSVKGFRTIVRKGASCFQPFFKANAKNVKRDMYIRQNSFKIVETDSENAIETAVSYFILPSEDFGAVVRQTEIKNLGGEEKVEILDGMPRIIPYGVSGSDFSRMANLMRSYNTLSNIENKIPMIYNEIKGDDDDEVTINTGGYFYMSFDENGLITPIYDPMAIFGEDTSLIYPTVFEDGGIDSVLSVKQHSTNKICGCFTPIKRTLRCGESVKINTLVGFAPSKEFINEKAKIVLKSGWIDEKLECANALAEKFTDDIKTVSGCKMLDMYFRQCYLDNFLRGGYVFSFGDGKIVHLFSRKHGDPERDYNFFSTAAEYFSQGDGNFRDVSQNRRNDCIFHPECGDFDIVMFYSLAQFDGYNPLTVKGTTFSVKSGSEDTAAGVISEYIKDNAEVVTKIISKRFTAGQLINGIHNNFVTLTVSDDEFLDKILSLCNQNIEASTDKFGNWSDHFDYNMDLVDCYLKIFPDKLETLLFGNRNYAYFDSDLFIRPRSEKYVFNGKDARQYTAYTILAEKYDRGYIKNGTNWLKTADGTIYKTDLFEKLFSLCVNKFALLDPSGMGIEMEAGRAGWCDATNGLPAMFGSGTSETIELIRMLKFARDCCEKYSDKTVEIPTELVLYYNNINKALDSFKNDFDYWDTVCAYREKFREETKYEISGKVEKLKLSDIKIWFERYIEKLEHGIEKALSFGDGFLPTYIKHEAVEYDILSTKSGKYNSVRVKAFKPALLPKYLEGPAKYLRETTDKAKAEKIVNEVKSSDVYDKKLKMYKTSESIECLPLEFGRIRAFTPGWQENESVFLHMEYKYLLAMLNAGLYDEFFSEMKNVFIPFLDPSVYGRSTLENCSFLVSSSNPDETLHGRGFVSRLSGSTTEVISVWVAMYLGKTPFVYENGSLGLRISPILPEWVFDEKGELSFNFLSKSLVTLHNPSKTATYKTSVDYIKIDGKRYEGATVFGDTAEEIRNGKKAKIDIYFR